MEAVFDPLTRKWSVPEGEEDPTAGRMGLTFADRQAMKAGAAGSPTAMQVNSDMAAAAQSSAKAAQEPLLPQGLGGWIGDTFKAGSNVAVGMGTGLVDLGLLAVDAARASTGDFGGLTQGLNQLSPKLGSAKPITWSEVGESKDNPLTAWRIQTLTPESTTFKAISYMGEIASWFVNPKGLGGVAAKGLKAATAVGRAEDLAGVLKGAAKGDEAIGGLIGAVGKIKEGFATERAARFTQAVSKVEKTPLANSSAAKRIIGAIGNADPVMARQMERVLINSASRNPLVRMGYGITGNLTEWAASPWKEKVNTLGEVVLKDLYANFMVMGARPVNEDASGMSRWLADNTPPPFSAAARYLVPEEQDAALVSKAKMLVEGAIIGFATQPLIDAARVGLMARRNRFSDLSPEFRDQILRILESPTRASDYVALKARQLMLSGGEPRALLPPGAVGYPGPERPLLPSRATSLDDLRARVDATNAASSAAKALNRTAQEEQTFQAGRQVLETLAAGPSVETMPGGPRPAWEAPPIGERGYGKSFTQGELAANEGKAPKPAWEGAEGGEPPAPGGAEPGWVGPPARPGEPAPVPQWQPLPTPKAVVSPDAIRNAAKDELEEFLARNANDGGVNPEALAAKVEEVGRKVIGLLPPDRAGRVDYMKTFLPRVNRAGVMDPIDSIWHDGVTKQGLEEGWVRMADDFSGYQLSRAEAQALDESDALSKLADEVFQATEQERLLKAGAEPEVPAAEQTVDVQAAPVEQAPVNPTDQSIVTQAQAKVQAAGNQLQDTVQAGVDRQPAPSRTPISEGLGRDLDALGKSLGNITRDTQQFTEGVAQQQADRMGRLQGMAAEEAASIAPQAAADPVARAVALGIPEAALKPLKGKMASSMGESLRLWGVAATREEGTAMVERAGVFVQASQIPGFDGPDFNAFTKYAEPMTAQGNLDIQQTFRQLYAEGADLQPMRRQGSLPGEAAADMPTEVMGQEPAQPSIADQFQAANDLNLAVDQRAQANTQARLERMKGMLQELVDNPGAAGTPARAMNERRAKMLISDLEGASQPTRGALEAGVDEEAAARALQDEVFAPISAPVPPKLTDSFEISLPKISQNEKAMLAEAFGTGEGKVAFGAYSAKGGAKSMGEVAEMLEGMTRADGWTQSEIRTGASLSKKIRRALEGNAAAINEQAMTEGMVKEAVNDIKGLPNCDLTELL